MTGWRVAALLLAWLLGVALQLQQAELWPAGVATAEWSIALVAVGLACRLGPFARDATGAAERYRRWLRDLLLGIAAAAAGHAATELQAASRVADALSPALEGRDIEVVGVVASLPQRGASGLRFRFEVEQAHWRGESVALPKLLAIGWYSGWHEDAAEVQPRDALRAGQRWRLTVRLRRPHGNFNPHGFDYELFLFEQAVRATGYVRDAPNALIDTAAGYPVERLRQRVRDAIERSVADRRAAGVLAALAVGDQSAIERDDWQLFRNTGIAHLVSISGLHITMFAWLAGGAIKALWRRSSGAMLRVAAPHAARWGGLVLAAAYAVFSGWGVPAQRTIWMLAMVTFLYTSGRRWPWPLVLLGAACVVTLADPWALLQAGFWLSFAAIGLLMAAANDRPIVPASSADTTLPAGAAVSRWRRAGRWVYAASADAVRTQTIATLGLAPLTLVFFQQLSLVGLLANLVAIPMVTLLITPLALLGALASPLWAIGAALVRALSDWLGWLASWPLAVWTSATAPGWAQAAGLIGALLIVMPLPWRIRLLGFPLALPLLLPPLDRPPFGSFELVAVDVGQGTAVLVRTREHLLVYDSGPQYARDSDAGQRVLLPLLRSRGERRIDRLILSHRDTDHVGGARSLLQALPVGELLSSLDPAHPLLASATPHRRCLAGERWQWDRVEFEILHPAASDFVAGAKPNSLSCVLRVHAAGAASAMSALLTGDIEKPQEAALVDAAATLRSDVLIVPHHGSRTSSSQALLDAAAPGIAVFQTGYRNRFGHPAPDVVARYRERGIRIVVSPDCGAWTWRGGTGVCDRDMRRRYWHHRGAKTS